MSKISQIFDALKAHVVAVLPATYYQIPNPYTPDEANQQYLVKGYGIGIGPAEPVVMEICPKYGRSRTFSIILVNIVTSQVNDGAGFETLQKALLEDFHLVQKRLEANGHLGISGGEQIAVRTDMQADSGIIALQTGVPNRATKFIAIQSDWTVVYRENLT